jgi:predicted Zn-dependent peptidase
MPIVDLLAEVCREPIFDSIEIERGIVTEEILESLDARGRRVSADDLLREAAFPRHPLGFPIAGNLDTLSRFGRAALGRHHRRHYTAGLVLTIAGRFSRRGLLAQIGCAFDLPRAHRLFSPKPQPPAGPAIRHVRDGTSQTALRLSFRAVGEHHRDEAATELLLRVVDDGTSTRLYHRVCDERGLCYDVSALYESYEDVGLLDFAADCSHEHTPEVLDEILGIARDLAQNGPTDDELDKARARLRFQLAATRDSPADLGAFYGFSELAGLSRTPAARIRELEAVSRKQVRRVAERLFRPERLALVTVGETGRTLSRRVQRAVAALA